MNQYQKNLELVNQALERNDLNEDQKEKLLLVKKQLEQKISWKDIDEENFLWIIDLIKSILNKNWKKWFKENDNIKWTWYIFDLSWNDVERSKSDEEKWKAINNWQDINIKWNDEEERKKTKLSLWKKFAKNKLRKDEEEKTYIIEQQMKQSKMKKKLWTNLLN